MPFTIARIEREKTIAGLARNLFDLSNATPAQRRRVERELLRLNPKLRSRDNFASGGTVIVPVVPGLRATPRATARDAPLGPLLARAIADTRLGLEEAGAGLEAAKKRAEEARDKLGNDRLRERIRKDLPNSEPVLDAASEGIGKRFEKDQSRLETLSEALEQTLKQLARLEKMSGSG